MLDVFESNMLEQHPLDTNVLDDLRKYNIRHTGQEICDALQKIWPLNFHVSSVSKLNKILYYFNDVQRQDFIDSLNDTLPACSPCEWVVFLSYCTKKQCTHFLQKISEETCADLHDMHHGFFVQLILKAELFSLDLFKHVLDYIDMNLRDLVSENFNLSLMRFTGDEDCDINPRIKMILDFLEPTLKHKKISVKDLIESFSLNIGAIYWDKNLWMVIVKTYLVGLASHLPYIFHTPQQVQDFYQKLALENQRHYCPPGTNTSIHLLFSAEQMEQEFSPSVQDSLKNLPNLYRFLSKYRIDANEWSKLLIIDALDSVKVTDFSNPQFEQAFRKFLRKQLENASIRSSIGYVLNFARMNKEEEFIQDLSNLNQYWLTILNTSIAQLNLTPDLSMHKKQAIFRAYIANIERENPSFFLKTKSALGLSAVLVLVGLAMFITLPVGYCAAVIASGLLLGFFAYNAQPKPTNLDTQSRL